MPPPPCRRRPPAAPTTWPSAAGDRPSVPEEGGRVHADGACRGYEEEHPAAEIPSKRPPGGRLAEDEEGYNRALAGFRVRFRVRIEPVLARLNSFRALRDVFR